MTKKMRERIYTKYNGHCAYCGKEISIKDMQVDHIIPRYHKGEDNEENLNPACRACNFYKSTWTMETFRENIRTMIDRLEKVFIFKLAVKYGLIEIKKKPIKFYFEKEAEQ